MLISSQAAGEAQAKAESDIQAKYMEVEYLRNELLELGTRAEEQKNLLEERNQSSDAIKKVINATLLSTLWQVTAVHYC